MAVAAIVAGGLLGAVAGGAVGITTAGVSGAVIGAGVGGVAGLAFSAAAYGLSRPPCWGPAHYPYCAGFCPIILFPRHIYFTYA